MCPLSHQGAVLGLDIIGPCRTRNTEIRFLQKDVAVIRCKEYFRSSFISRVRFHFIQQEISLFLGCVFVTPIPARELLVVTIVMTACACSVVNMSYGLPKHCRTAFRLCMELFVCKAA